MFNKISLALGLVVAAGLAASCSAAPVDETGETGESEKIATESEEMRCLDCDEGAGEYEPYFPFDDACGYGETKWNSAANCGPNKLCSSGTGCSPMVGRCGSNGCGPGNSTTSNPCYGKWYGCGCTASGGYGGTCKYNWQNVLACFAN